MLCCIGRFRWLEFDTLTSVLVLSAFSHRTLVSLLGTALLSLLGTASARHTCKSAWHSASLSLDAQASIQSHRALVSLICIVHDVGRNSFRQHKL